MLLDYLLELKENVDRHGIRFGLFITLFAMFRKERRNYRLDRRDELHKAYFEAILHNERIIMQHLGAEGDWMNGSLKTYEKTDLLSSKLLFFGSYMEGLKRKFPYPRRIHMLKLITTSAGRKIVYFILASAVTYLNNRFGLNLNSDTLFGVWGAAITLMQLEAHFNLKQFISAAINALSGAAQTATTTTTGQPITTATAPPMTQQEATQLLQELNGLLTPIYDSAKSGRYSDTTVQALNAAVTIRDYLKQQKGA